jgi:cytochrome b561
MLSERGQFISAFLYFYINSSQEPMCQIKGNMKVSSGPTEKPIFGLIRLHVVVAFVHNSDLQT